MANADGIFKIANVRRLPDENAYDPRILTEITEKFANYIANGAATSSRTPVVIGATIRNHDDARKGPMPRRTMLKNADFVRYGLTGGCPGCQWIQNPVGQSRNHTEDCRRRIEIELAKTDEGQERLRKAQDRIDHKVAEIIEA